MASCALSLTPVNGELRIYDLHLAERLGFSQARDIRKIIKRYLDKLLKFGQCATVARCIEIGNGGKQQVEEFYLNQKQAIFVCMKSETDKAADVQVEIVHVFDAYLNGQLAPQPRDTPTLTTEQWNVISDLIRDISLYCRRREGASHAAHERIRFAFGLRHSSDLLPQNFEEARADLEGLKDLAKQHMHRLITLDEEFITAVIRPPVSIRKVRAMAKKAVSQPLNF